MPGSLSLGGGERQARPGQRWPGRRVGQGGGRVAAGRRSRDGRRRCTSLFFGEGERSRRAEIWPHRPNLAAVSRRAYPARPGEGRLGGVGAP